MPSITRTLLSGFTGSPESIAVPSVCEKAKTINKNYASIFIFRDTANPQHSEYLVNLLPIVFLKNFTAEQYVSWFRNLPSGSFLEIDLGKKLCYLCSLTP